jgi:hypothetical protein
MAVYVEIAVQFPDNRQAQWFSSWLYRESYTNKSLSKDTVTVNLRSHSDRVVVVEEAKARGGTIVTDNVQEDAD